MNWTIPYPCRSRSDSVRRINMSSEPGNESFFCALRPIPRILSLQRQITRIKFKASFSRSPNWLRKTGVHLVTMGYPSTMLMMVLALLLQQPPKPQTDVERLPALQRSKECRDAGETFFQREGYAGLASPVPDYFTHYNREQSKCFIFISGLAKAEPGEDKAGMYMQVFDVIKGVMIASKILRWNGNDYVTAAIRIRDSRGIYEHRPQTPADEVWFENLMIR